MAKDSFIKQAVLAVRSVLDRNKDDVPLHEPLFEGREWQYVKECLDTGWVSSIGKYVDRFEEKLAEYTGVRKAIAVVNGTAALQISLQLAGVQNYEEVLVPALSFVATSNAVLYSGAIPHFVDCEERTLGLDVGKLREYLNQIGESRNEGVFNRHTGRKLAAVVPMHVFGHPVDMDPLVELCKQFSIPLVEDAAESLGSFYKGRHTGNFGSLSAISFNGNKILTTGGGGAILTNSEDLASLARHITTTARTLHKWDFSHDMLGYNYRMPNINAALGCAQLENLQGYVQRKRELAKRYGQALCNFKEFYFFLEPKFSKSNYWLNAIILNEKYSGWRDVMLEELNAAGLKSRPVWTLLSKLPMNVHFPAMDLTVAESLSRRIINIPSSANL